MASQKVENLLNLAMDATEEEREKSLELDVGYDAALREWDLIIRYSGDLSGVRTLTDEIVELLNGFAVITIREDRIEQLAALPEVEYIEKPKRLFFQVINGRRVSCINLVQDSRFSLFGTGILVGIIDSGIDYGNMDFRNPDGTTRIRALWDQSAAADEQMQRRPPEGYVLGVEYSQEQINMALRASTDMERLQMVSATDLSGHGTAVAGIAAGNGAQYAGVAPQSELLVVKLANPRPDGFPRTTELIQAVDYMVRKAAELGMPLALNISFGNTYGSHDGTSLLERYMDGAADYGRTCICVGMGNEARSAGHTSGILQSGEETQIELVIQEFQTSMNIQIWKSYTDQVQISLYTPSGMQIGPFQEILGPQRFSVGGTEILLYYGEPSPYSTNQEIFIDMIPRGSYIDAGIWRIGLSAERVVSGRYDLWLPSENVLNPGTGFRYPTPVSTLTIPSSASRVISVGAYDARTFAYADFSGRGPLAGMAVGGDGRAGMEVWGGKPDLASPGVGVITTSVGGGYAAVTGTSFATPFVTGAAALLMEWGIVRGNDPYLYGEKVKAYLRRGARPLPGFAVYPNNQVGYGALCVRDSLPI